MNFKPRIVGGRAARMRFLFPGQLSLPQGPRVTAPRGRSHGPLPTWFPAAQGGEAAGTGSQVVWVTTEPQPPSARSVPPVAEAKLPFLAPALALAWDENRPRAQRLLQGLPGTAAGPQGDPEGLPGEPYGSAYVRAPHSEVLTELIQAEAWASLRFSRASSWF